MTTKPTIDGVSRKLIERIADHCKFWKDHTYLEAISDIEPDLRALLGREVITDDHLRQRIAFLTSEVHARAGERDASQATIAQLEAEKTRLQECLFDLNREFRIIKSDRELHAQLKREARSQRDVAYIKIEELEARVADLERERGELVAEIISKFGDPEAFGERELISVTDISKFPYGTRLYACLDATAALNGVKS